MFQGFIEIKPPRIPKNLSHPEYIPNRTRSIRTFLMYLTPPSHVNFLFFSLPILGTLISFTTSLHMYMVLRIIIGFASMTVTVVSFVLVVEYVSGRWRIIIGILNLLPVPLSYVITAGIAYVAREWRLMQILTSSPWVILLVMW